MGQGPSRSGLVAVVPTDSEVVIRQVFEGMLVIVLAERKVVRNSGRERVVANPHVIYRAS